MHCGGKTEQVSFLNRKLSARQPLEERLRVAEADKARLITKVCRELHLSGYSGLKLSLFLQRSNLNIFLPGVHHCHWRFEYGGF